jgi:hypothetical protein
MLFKQKFLQGIVSGEVTLAFRRWRRPSVRAGGRLRTWAGVVAIGAVDVVAADAITTRDARRAGYADRAELLEDLGERGDTLYRIELRFAGADPRRELRAKSELSAEDIAELQRRLARFDAASRRGPWTRVTLELIARHPGKRAADLAASIGRDRLSFKTDVRKLKELGLTESLEVGYRLSPRGLAFLQSPTS